MSIKVTKVYDKKSKFAIANVNLEVTTEEGMVLSLGRVEIVENKEKGHKFLSASTLVRGREGEIRTNDAGKAIRIDHVLFKSADKVDEWIAEIEKQVKEIESKTE